MSSGRAILSSDIPVLREILNENNSILVPSGQLLPWKQALMKLDEKRDFCADLGLQARRDFEAEFQWDQRAKMILHQLL